MPDESIWEYLQNYTVTANQNGKFGFALTTSERVFIKRHMRYLKIDEFHEMTDPICKLFAIKFSFVVSNLMILSFDNSLWPKCVQGLSYYAI